MDADPEILDLLRKVLDGEYNASSLAKWFAENSLRFYESPNEVDRMIVADLDAALGEIQRGSLGDEFLIETAKQLEQGLNLILPSRVIFIDLADSQISMHTGSANEGGSSMAIGEVEKAQSSASPYR